MNQSDKKKFVVRVQEVWTQDIEIEADSEKEARTLVEEGEGEALLGHNHFEYSHTLDAENWQVARKD